MTNVFVKFVPGLAKLGWETALELIGVASVGSFALDKGTDFVKEKLNGKLENKKQELLKKQAEVLAQKAEKAAARVNEIQEVNEEVVEEKTEKTSKKKNK